MDHVLTPFPFVGKLSIRVIERSSALHFVIHPFPTIFPSFFVVERSKSISHMIFFITLITASTVLLSHIIPMSITIVFYVGVPGRKLWIPESIEIWLFIHFQGKTNTRFLFVLEWNIWPLIDILFAWIGSVCSSIFELVNLARFNSFIRVIFGDI